MANERQAMAMERAELQIELLALKEQKAERRGLNPTVNTTVSPAKINPLAPLPQLPNGPVSKGPPSDP
jgi:hypothetical protein